ncbi:MAG: hypothetical protein K8S20_00720 [Chloroflexi bacterium]|nr:hypothetical protein [Chloroflexota bacterium]
MQIVQAPRASAILYSLIARQPPLPWLLPANICPIVPITFLKAHIPFEFADISASSLHMDQEQALERVKAGKFGGLLYAHTYGEPSTPQAFFAEIKELDPDLLIVDDRCLCQPDLEPIPSADVILYSTGYAKIVDLGHGGYAFIDDRLSYKPAYLPFNVRHHEEIERQYKAAVQDRLKFDYQDCDWLESGNSQVNWPEYRVQIESGLKTSLAGRSLINQIYENALPKEIQLPEQYQMWRFNIRVKEKARILGAIFEEGLFASSHYASLAGIMADGLTPQADSLAGEVINLFNDFHFDEKKAQKICDVIIRNL